MKCSVNTIVAAAAVATFVVFKANADDAWFDAGISQYEAWPSDGSDKIVEGQGEWKGTSNATFDPNRKTLDIVSTANSSLDFNPALQKDVGSSGLMKISFSTRFTVSDWLPDPVQGDKCALAVRMSNDGTATNYCAAALDAAGGTNAWTVLEGPVPVTDSEVAVEINLKRDGGRSYACYSIDGTLLTLGGSEWIETVDSQSPVGKVAFCGRGSLSALAAEDPAPVEMVDLTIPAKENITIASVSVAGVDVPLVDGKYSVPAGSVVTVVFKPAAGYAIGGTASTVTYVVFDNLTLAAEDMPDAINVAQNLTINEIMAKNGVSLVSAAGKSELDWVELHNSGDDDIDLAGWYLFDDPSKAQSKWAKIQGSCVVRAHGYKIVFADKDFTGTANEAWTAIGLSTGGESLFLADPEGNVIHRVDFPAQMEDISYGLGNIERTVLSAHDAAQYRIGEGEWHSITGSVGMCGTAGGFTVTAYQMNKDNTANIDKVLAAIAANNYSKKTVTENVYTIAFQQDGSQTNFQPYAAFSTLGVSGNYFAVVVEGSVYIPHAGSWTFSVGSDDGYTLEVFNDRHSYSSEYSGPRGYGQSPSAFHFPEPGAYNVKLVYFQVTGAATLDFSVAEGDHTDYEGADEEFSTEHYKLVGSAESGVTHAGRWAAYSSNDVTDEMKDVSKTLEWKSTFVLPDAPSAGDTCKLNIRYADGFTARVNGTQIATVAAASKRSLAQALAPASFEFPYSLLVKGENTIEVTVENNAIGDNELFLSPEISIKKGDPEYVYFKESTPGAANTTAGKGSFTPKVAFSVPHGWKTEPFEVSLSCAEAPNSPIYYTLDGTSPTTASYLYTGPISVSRTTCIRAAVPQSDAIMQMDSSATYLFAQDVIRQDRETVPAGFPASGAINSQVMRFGLDQNYVNGDTARVLNGFTNEIATLSLVIDPKNLFDSSSGIYVNPTGDGRAWERATMVEQIDPVNGESNEFSSGAGLRIRGAFSRNVKYPKHSLRLLFRPEYGGENKLEFPLFGDEGTDKFKKVDLRTSQNYAWATDNTGDTFVHDVFSRDSQRDMGEHYARSRYYHLFINGQYWGLYQTEERGDDNFAESYNGGDADNYDVIKTSQPGYVTGATEGNAEAWEALWNIAVNEGFTGAYASNYKKAMGLNPDGSRNPEYPIYLNPTNLAVYMLVSHYTCDSDCPASTGDKNKAMANNIYALRNRVDGDGKSDGFFFLRHDAEHSMGVNKDRAKYSSDPTQYGNEIWNANFRNKSAFNPSELNYTLAGNKAGGKEGNPEYKMLLADLFYKHCLKPGGALTAEKSRARFESRMAEIENSIACEIARWRKDTSVTYGTWTSACNNSLTFIENRTSYMLSQYRNRGWYPSIDPSVALNGAGATLSDGMTVAADDSLYLSGDGTVYYTLDGSDPRAEGGAVAAGAMEYSGAAPAPVDMPVIAKGDTWKYSDAGAKPGDNWTAADYDDSGWSTGAGRLGFASSGSFGTTINRYVGGGSSGTQVTTYYFRKTFTMPAGAELVTELKAALDCDDGYIAYINGVEVKRDQVASADYGAFSTATNMGEKNDTFVFPAGTLVEGENVIAVEVHQCNATSTDAWWDLALSYAKAGNVEGGIAVPAEGLSVTMRVLSQSGEWSALETVKVKGEEVLSTPVEAVRIAAVYSSTLNGGDDGEFIVLTNITENAVLLDGLRIISKKHGNTDASLTLTLPDLRIEACSSVVLDKAAYWPDSKKKITNGEVDMQLLDPKGDTIQTLFFSSKWWNKIADGTGVWLVAKEFGTAVTEESQWKPSESWVEKNLRFFEFDGIPADGNGGDTGEYFVLTNLSETVTLNLSNVVVNICKSGDAESASKCIVTIPAMTTLAPGATVRFDQATYWNGSKQKITNGALVMKIYDAEGATVQVSTPNQNDAAFANYKAKASSTSGGPVLRATSFARETTTADWMEYTPPAPADWPDDPETEITETTKPADLGITSGAFTNAAPQELIKLAKWAKENSVSYAGEAVNAMSFDENGNPATVFEEAYLLNCAVDEVEEKKADFKFDSITPGVVPEISKEDSYNGKVHILGCTSLELKDWNDVEGMTDAAKALLKFYKAVLRRL